MAFGEVSTFYIPIAASAGASLWGTDVRRVNTSADGTADTTTICNHGTTASAQNRTVDPYTTTTTDADESLYGWAIQPTDMGSVSGAERRFAAGNHVATFRGITNALTGANVDVKFTAYRVGPSPGRTRTQIATTTAATSFGATAGGGSVITVTLACPEIIFAADETIQWSFEFSSPGVVVTGKTTTMVTGTSATGATQARVETPPLQTIARTTGTSNTAVAAAAAVMAAIGAMAGTSAGIATAAAAGGSVSETVGTSAGVATAAATLAAFYTTTGTSDGVATASGALAAVGSTVGTAAGAAAVSGEMSQVLGTAGSSAGEASVSGVTAATAATVGSSAGVAAASGSFGAVSETTGAAAGVATVTGNFAVVAPTVGTVNVSEGGGGGETFIRPLFVFDD